MIPSPVPDERLLTIEQPTGGVVLLTDSRPSEDKALIERQVKKAQTKAATDTTVPQTPAPASRSQDNGAASAASVLSAVDEDEEGVEEAQVPDEFDYHSDPEDAE